MLIFHRAAADKKMIGELILFVWYLILTDATLQIRYTLNCQRGKDESAVWKVVLSVPVKWIRDC